MKAKKVLTLGGGGGRMICLLLGAFIAFLEKQLKVDAVVGTSAGAIAGGAFAFNPDLEYIKKLTEQFVSLKAKDVFGRFWRIKTVYRVTRIVFDKLFLGKSRYSSVLDSKPVRDLIWNMLPNVLLKETTLQYVAVVDWLEHRQLVGFSSSDNPLLYLPTAAYASGAQIPYLEPYWSNNATFTDGGAKEIIPFKMTKKIFEDVEEVWMLGASFDKGEAEFPIEGVFNVFLQQIDSVLDDQLEETLKAARKKKDGIKVHTIDLGEGAPSAGFTDWFPHAEELVEVGRNNMKEYLNNPNPFIY